MLKCKLIGFTGQAGAGKDTAANILLQKINDIQGLDSYPILCSFAGPLKAIINQVFNWNEQHATGSLKEVVGTWQLNPKTLKQTFLTSCKIHLRDLVYKIDPDYLYEKFLDTVILPYSNQTLTLTCSPRQIYQKFGTEFGRSISPTLWVDAAKQELDSRGSLIVTDVRFDNEAAFIKDNGGMLLKIVRNDNTLEVPKHASEAGVDSKYITLTIENHGTMEELENAIDVFIEYYLIDSNTLPVLDIMEAL